MEWYHITFRSITPAQRGERLIKQKGLDATLMRAVRQLSLEGCGYSLRIKPKDGGAAIELLRENRVPFRRVFHQENGEVRELEL